MTPGGGLREPIEYAHMMKKQEDLNLHHIPCTKLTSVFEGVCGNNNLDCEISQVDFCAILASCKLLKADFPRTDERWQRFYSKFVIINETVEGVRG